MAGPLRFYTSEKLGENQSLTPDGFLLCQNVPLARTGTLLYSDMDGIPVESDRDGIIRVTRDAEEVFAPIAISSFAGKPVTDDHPPEKVAPVNWKQYSVGVVLNPRRGDGLMFDNQFLYADLLIQDEAAIRAVREGKREVSAGYDAEYEQVEPGYGRQHLIIGNHVALVEKGRCGPRCAIGDSAMATNRRRPAWFDQIMRAHRTNDEETLVDTLEKVGEMMGVTGLPGADPGSGGSGGYGPSGAGSSSGGTGDDMGGSGIHVHVHNAGARDESDDPPAAAAADPAAVTEPAAGSAETTSLEDLSARVEALERAVAILAQGEGEEEAVGEEDPDATENGPNGKQPGEDDDKPTGDRARAMVGDSSSMRPAWQELLSRAEFLAPGIKAPTFDAKRSAKTTFDAMCQFRRKVLADGLKEDDTKNVILSVAGSAKPNLTQMTCDAVSILFNGASEMVRRANVQGTSSGLNGGRHGNSPDAMMQSTVQRINEANRKKYGYA